MTAPTVADREHIEAVVRRVIIRVRNNALEDAAKVAEQHHAGRLSARVNALERKQKSEARDHESMAIEALHIAAAIRTKKGERE